MLMAYDERYDVDDCCHKHADEMLKMRQLAADDEDDGDDDSNCGNFLQLHTVDSWCTIAADAEDKQEHRH